VIFSSVFDLRQALLLAFLLCEKLHDFVVADLVEVDIVEAYCEEWLGCPEADDLIDLLRECVDSLKGSNRNGQDE
jgi:hypothetical protein